MFFDLQENYLGEDIAFTDYESSGSTKERENSLFEHVISNIAKPDSFDARVYRPFEVKVEVTLHEIQAHLMKVGRQDGAKRPNFMVAILQLP